ncbi:hypothetical protein BT96DRAFT_829564 [Gymnopus androsaceus JB14]|uniref:cAMP-independent regulatory protein pac2 n=1 Tax=Gymnopus androsaceus JB14 TaxID=1447944 RepID=A0A6A4H601_9AGAR|nr:hypothetical protein BT96DRAFT_829564 [Gymnopus androsaceus JB14]
MQQPTCTSIRIRSTADAHKIFHAVQHGKLRMVTRRLDADERLALVSGCVYAWEERGPHTEITGLGIERFTEGRRWSPSRVRDEFLFYYEKYTPPESAQSRHPQAPRDWDPLVKQTYSVWVETEKGKRKWHLTAYFTQATVDNLGTIDNIPGVGDLQVPEGMFKSTRLSKIRSSSKLDEPARSNDSALREAVVPARTYAAFPAPPYPLPVQSQNGSQPIQMYEPYAQYPHSRSPEQTYAATTAPRQVPLPTRTPYQNGNRVVPQSEYGQQDPSRYLSSPRVIAAPPAPLFVVHHSHILLRLATRQHLRTQIRQSIILRKYLLHNLHRPGMTLKHMHNQRHTLHLDPNTSSSRITLPRRSVHPIPLQDIHPITV